MSLFPQSVSTVSIYFNHMQPVTQVCFMAVNHRMRGYDWILCFWRGTNGLQWLQIQMALRATFRFASGGSGLTQVNLQQHSLQQQSRISLRSRLDSVLSWYAAWILKPCPIISSICPACYSNPIPDPAVNLSVTPELALNLSVAHVTVGGAIRFFNSSLMHSDSWSSGLIHS